MQKQTSPDHTGCVYTTSTISQIIENAQKIERIGIDWSLRIHYLLDAVEGLGTLLELESENCDPATIGTAIQEITKVITERFYHTSDHERVENIRRAVKEYQQTTA